MKDSIELKIDPTGVIESIYQDGIEQFADEVGADIAQVCRASEVEWEEVEAPLNARFPRTKGWSVRSVKNGLKALRIESSLNAGVGERYIDTIVCSDNTNLAIALFESREEAIKEEVKHFWELKNG